MTKTLNACRDTGRAFIAALSNRNAQPQAGFEEVFFVTTHEAALRKVECELAAARLLLPGRIVVVLRGLLDQSVLHSADSPTER